jgi:ABC-type transport system involved in multi-copper enzyme maturation permease subunit
VSAAATIALYALRESLRRRVLYVVGALSVGFVVLFALGVHFAFDSLESQLFDAQRLFDERVLVGSTLVGLGMFATLFLGAVLAVFLTLGIVRGDAEAGLLQPLVVRPVGRRTMLAARYATAAALAALYVGLLYTAVVVITGASGGWWPDEPVLCGLALAGAVAVIAAISTVLSVVLGSTAQGIASLMVFGAGLTAGLMGQIGNALESPTLETIGDVASWALPFEALYQAGLHLLTADTFDLARTAVRLGPFGGSEQAGIALVPFAIGYVVIAIGVAIALFARRDL